MGKSRDQRFVSEDENEFIITPSDEVTEDDIDPEADLEDEGEDE